ncbi:MAG TPA: hypothetical protein VJ969_08540 [Desulfopila sp.]|nr:hypothetical protein [Desulfopila sp.]
MILLPGRMSSSSTERSSTSAISVCSLLRRQVEVLTAFEERGVVEVYRAIVRQQQTGDHIHQGRFAAAAGSENSASVTCRRKFGLEAEVAKTFADINVEVHGVTSWPDCG